MIKKKTFVNIINELRAVSDFFDRFNTFLKENEIDGYIYPPNCFDSIIWMIEELFDDPNNTVGYYCYELNFGEKGDGCIEEEDGTKISLTSPEELYDYLLNQRE